MLSPLYLKRESRTQFLMPEASPKGKCLGNWRFLALPAWIRALLPVHCDCVKPNIVSASVNNLVCNYSVQLESVSNKKIIETYSGLMVNEVVRLTAIIEFDHNRSRILMS